MARTICERTLLQRAGVCFTDLGEYASQMTDGASKPLNVSPNPAEPENQTLPVGSVPSATKDSSAARRHDTSGWTIFLDELPMPRRPATAPGKLDREVFVRQLPEDVASEEALCDWAEENFGQVEQVLILADDLAENPVSKAYIRFTEHAAASLCVDSEGNHAAWSEAERCSQRSRSVYAADLHRAFLGQTVENEVDTSILKRVLDKTGAVGLWLNSEVQQWCGAGSAPVEVQYECEEEAPPQLRFCVECEWGSLGRVRDALSGLLALFHDRAEKWLRPPPPASRKQRMLQRKFNTKVEGSDSVVPKASIAHSQRVAKEESMEEVPTGKNLVWDSATGVFRQEDLPDEVQMLIGLQEPHEPQVKRPRFMQPVKTEVGGTRRAVAKSPAYPPAKPPACPPPAHLIAPWRRDSVRPDAESSSWRHSVVKEESQGLHQNNARTAVKEEVRVADELDQLTVENRQLVEETQKLQEENRRLAAQLEAAGWRSPLDSPPPRARAPLPRPVVTPSQVESNVGMPPRAWGQDSAFQAREFLRAKPAMPSRPKDMGELLRAKPGMPVRPGTLQQAPRPSSPQVVAPPPRSVQWPTHQRTGEIYDFLPSNSPMLYGYQHGDVD